MCIRDSYKGKQIAYSLGNLVFGGNNNPADKNCLIYRHTFTLDLDSRQAVSYTHLYVYPLLSRRSL